ncbi:MAG: hypothetical protein IJV28_07190 [Paludibacteraceae bacterium]|nr:hypothetical protein [Paludibacteraceae bacterium]
MKTKINGQATATAIKRVNNRQYDEWDRVILTREEEDSMRQLIRKNEYHCPTLNQYKALVRRYQRGDDVEKSKVIYLLTDCNFHQACGLLEDGRFKEALKAY